MAALGSGATTAGSGGRAWYVDCAAGDDDAGGLSPASAWRTTQRVSGRLFRPGDAIFFRRGGVCSGMLWPKGSGSLAAPIHLGAFGIGPHPRIEATAGQEAAFKLAGQEYWTVEHLDFSGGNPHGIFVTGVSGTLHGIHIRDVVVHDVNGEPKNKEGGLLVIAPGGPRQRFDDVIVDGVTAYRTSQWAGILVGGNAWGFLPEASRSTHVIVRNSIVADVSGDGIVLFQVNGGIIENCVSWYTGMQQQQTIGTPNAIWTWMCRDCVVRRSEAFLADSPGVDGGAFDIDYGDTDNIVEDNYGHDTEGYCVAIFGAGWVTKNSIVRNNVCSGNGRSPRLARSQGAIFLATWNHGSLRGVQLSGNRIFWAPPIAAAALVNTAVFEGGGAFEDNILKSSTPEFIRSNALLSFDRNTYRYTGAGDARWEYGAMPYMGFKSWQRGSGQDAHSTFTRAPDDTARKRPCELLAFVSASPQDTDSRGQIPLLIGLHRQFPDLPLRIVTSAPAESQGNLRFDWNTGDIPIDFEARPSYRVSALPAIIITGPSGEVLWRHDGFTRPGDLGLAIRSFAGQPDYARMTSHP